MPRARTSTQDYQQTASTETGSGCLSLFSLPILAVFVITCLITALSLSTPVTISASPQINSTNSISPIFTKEVQYWAGNITRWADASSLDPNLIATVMQIESCGDPRALSPAGAMGLFQVMPYHFSGSDAPYNPDTNALRGLAYLEESLSTHQNIRLALAGYNGGIGTAGKPESQWPSETIRYAYWGIGIFQNAQSGEEVSERLEEWYHAGGASLCHQAEQRLGISP